MVFSICVYLFIYLYQEMNSIKALTFSKKLFLHKNQHFFFYLCKKISMLFKISIWEILLKNPILFIFKCSFNVQSRYYNLNCSKHCILLSGVNMRGSHRILRILRMIFLRILNFYFLTFDVIENFYYIRANNVFKCNMSRRINSGYMVQTMFN